SRPISNCNRTAAQVLQRKTKPFVMRRLKRQVASELPDKLFKPLRCDLTALQRELYQAVVDKDLEKAIQAVGGKKLSLGNPHIFAILTKLKQICCHPGLITRDFQPYRAGVSGKFDVLMEILEDISISERVATEQDRCIQSIPRNGRLPTLILRRDE